MPGRRSSRARPAHGCARVHEVLLRAGKIDTASRRPGSPNALTASTRRRSGDTARETSCTRDRGDAQRSSTSVLLYWRTDPLDRRPRLLGELRQVALRLRGSDSTRFGLVWTGALGYCGGTQAAREVAALSRACAPPAARSLACRRPRTVPGSRTTRRIASSRRRRSAPRPPRGACARCGASDQRSAASRR